MSKNFDESAASWDADQERKNTAMELAEAIKKHIALDNTLTALDFGCGTGLLSMHLLPYLKELLGIDTSKEMLNEFRQKINLQKLENVKLMNIDWEDGEFAPEFFDLIYSSLAFHHIQGYERLLELFHPALKDGGKLLIADLFAEEGDFHSDPSVAEHRGFDPEEFKALLLKIGFSSVSYEKVHTIEKEVKNGEKKEFPVFLMAAEK